MRALDRLKRSLRKRALFRKFGEHWKPEGAAFQKRSYDSYEAYLEHQKAKLKTHEFGHYDEEFRTTLRERLTSLELEWQGRNVLCLGARIGSEVKAFLDLGAFAVGIDLNPGEENRYVVQGDFHDLPYAPSSIDVVYTNSLDHAFDIERIAKEVLKVLKPGGLFLVEAVQGREQGINPGFFESFFWQNIDELVGVFEKAGLTVSPDDDFGPGRANKSAFRSGELQSRPNKTAITNRRSLRRQPFSTLLLERPNALRRILHAHRRNGIARAKRSIFPPPHALSGKRIVSIPLPVGISAQTSRRAPRCWRSSSSRTSTR